MNHTPGPWQAIGSIPSDGFDCFWINTQPSPALRGFTKNIACINGPQSDHECEANARLIAAAPDLLEALKAWMAHRAKVFDAQMRGDINKISIDAVNPIIDRAMAAIAKAEATS